MRSISVYEKPRSTAELAPVSQAVEPNHHRAQCEREQKRADHVEPTITRGVLGRLPNTAQPPRAAG